MSSSSLLKNVGIFLINFFDLLLYSVYIFGEKLFRLCVPRGLKSLDGEIILITGAGNGIGRQIAFELADVAPNATIICWDYENAPNEATVTDLRKRNVKAFGYVIDVSDRELVSRTAAQMRMDVGDVTIVVNNAGISPYSKFLSQDLKSIQRTFEINVFSHFWILREFMPKMIENNRGHIVTIASMAALIPSSQLVVYSASKHAVHGFIESLKREIRSYPVMPNINFTTVYPIFVQTRMTASVKFSSSSCGAFPFIITPEYVAQKTVEGFRRNYEHVYLPPSTNKMTLALRAIIPTAIWTKLEDSVFNFDFDESLKTSSAQTGIPDNTVETEFVQQSKPSPIAQTGPKLWNEESCTDKSKRFA